MATRELLQDAGKATLMLTDAKHVIYRCYLTLLILVALVAVMFISCGKVDYAERIEQHKRLAGELQCNRLHQAAIQEYGKVLEYDNVDNSTRANINYLIGRIYFEDLRDYGNAAAYYLRAREYDPEGSFINEASKNLVASLEKMGNVVDAKRQLDVATNVNEQPRNPDDLPVAKIGGQSIWLSDIDEQIRALPLEVQKQLLSKEAKQQFVHQYVGVELLYRAAMREDYLSEPDIQLQLEKLQKRLLVDRFVIDKVMPQVQVDTGDVRNYYLANKNDRYNGAPYDSVRSQVFLDYQSVKAEAAYSEYIGRLIKAEQVEFLLHNVR